MLEVFIPDFGNLPLILVYLTIFVGAYLKKGLVFSTNQLFTFSIFSGIYLISIKLVLLLSLLFPSTSCVVLKSNSSHSNIATLAFVTLMCVFYILSHSLIFNIYVSFIFKASLLYIPYTWILFYYS